MTAQEIEQQADELDPLVFERYAVEQLAAYDHYRAVEADAKRSKEKAAEPIRVWLDKHPGESLRDGETDLEASLRTRQGSESYDVGRMPKALLLQLWQANALNVDVRMLKALSDRSSLYIDCQTWRVPGPVTEYLEIVRRGVSS